MALSYLRGRVGPSESAREGKLCPEAVLKPNDSSGIQRGLAGPPCRNGDVSKIYTFILSSFIDLLSSNGHYDTTGVTITKTMIYNLKLMKLNVHQGRKN